MVAANPDPRNPLRHLGILGRIKAISTKIMTGLTIAGRTFGSRLLVGTGKFSSNQAMAECLEASGTEIVTVALRRADLTGQDDPYADILNFIDPKKYLLLPNTSG